MCKFARGGGKESGGRSHAGTEPRPGFLKRAEAGSCFAGALAEPSPSMSFSLALRSLAPPEDHAAALLTLQ